MSEESSISTRNVTDSCTGGMVITSLLIVTIVPSVLSVVKHILARLYKN